MAANINSSKVVTILGWIALAAAVVICIVIGIN